MKITLTLAIAALLLTPTASAQPSSTLAKYYITSLTLSDSLETKGLTFPGGRILIDTAFCTGLRRYGVRGPRYDEKFHRFKCNFTSSANHTYVLYARITAAPGATSYAQNLSGIRRLF